jgi:hypothetical protein
MCVCAHAPHIHAAYTQTWGVPGHQSAKRLFMPIYQSAKRLFMATLQERRLGYHTRAGLEPGTSGFSTLRMNRCAALGIYTFSIHVRTHTHTRGVTVHTRVYRMYTHSLQRGVLQRGVHSCNARMLDPAYEPLRCSGGTRIQCTRVYTYTPGGTAHTYTQHTHTHVCTVCTPAVYSKGFYSEGVTAVTLAGSVHSVHSVHTYTRV